MYLTKINPVNGEIMLKLANDISNNCKNILIVRTYRTGIFLDNFLPDNKSITRIIYSNKHYSLTKCHPSSIIIDYTELDTYIETLNMSFDLICLDPFHEFKESLNSLVCLSKYLTDTGILLCHDCFPPHIKYTRPFYTKGPWSGVTYVAFVNFSYLYPNLYYGVLKTEFGIGIVSKNPIDGLTNNFNKEKQEALFELLNNNSENTYQYFCENSKGLINALSKK